MKQQKHQEFSEICRRNGWKWTPQRLAVYEFASDNFSHPGVDEIWQNVRYSLPTVTRESVYRILNEFTAAGILQRLDHISNARYDWQTGPHGHFICEFCGEIVDFGLPEGTVMPSDPMPGKIRHIELRVSGVCRKCSKLKAKYKKEEKKS